MTIGNMLSSTFPATIKKDSLFFSSMIANDKESAAIEKVLNKLKDNCNTYVNNYNIYKQTGDMLTKTSNFFSFLKRYGEESDESFINRIKTLFVRDATSLGSRFDIISVFKKYFNTENVYIVNNSYPINTNLIQDYDFQTADKWIIENPSNCSYSYEARFSESLGVKFLKDGVIKQTVSVENNKIYFLHLFSQGEIEVEIKDTINNRYWNNEVYHKDGKWNVGKWQDEKFSFTCKTEVWNNFSSQIICDDNISQLEIKIIGKEDNSYLDYVRLFEYLGYPSFSVIIQNIANDNINALAVAPGTNDNIDNSELENYSYYNDREHDTTFFTGVQKYGSGEDTYNEILSYITVYGIQSQIEVLNKAE